MLRLLILSTALLAGCAAKRPQPTIPPMTEPEPDPDAEPIPPPDTPDPPLPGPEQVQPQR